MASRKQVAANRSNANKSTGPKTEVGKNRSRQNAWKHGLTAEQVVIYGETAEDYNVFRDGFMADFEPVNTMESELVGRLAGLLWRLRRVPVIEQRLMAHRPSPFGELILQKLSDEEFDQFCGLLEKAGSLSRAFDLEEPDSTDLGNGYLTPEPKQLDPTEMLMRLSRYETGLMNAVTKTLSLLHGLQHARLAKEEEARTIEGL